MVHIVVPQTDQEIAIVMLTIALQSYYSKVAGVKLKDLNKLELVRLVPMDMNESGATDVSSRRF